MSVRIKFLRCLFRGVLCAYALVVAAALGLRYVVLPRIDNWRPQIEQQAGKALGVPLQIGKVEADWSGLHPRLRLSNVRIQEPDMARAALTLPTVSAILSWSSVLRLAPRFLNLRIEGAQLNARRDAQGRFWVAGFSFDPGAASDQDDSPVLPWLLRQRQLGVYGATVRWHDDLRHSPELLLSNLDIVVRNGALAHRFSLRATPPAALAAGVQVRGAIEHRLFGRAGKAWSGEIYAQLDDAEPLAWAPWVDVPAVRGRVAARAWARLEDGKVRDVTLDTALRDLAWTAADGVTQVSVGQARARLDGVPGDVLRNDFLALGRGRETQGLQLTARASGVRAMLPRVFAEPDIAVDSLALDAALRHLPGEPAVLDVKQLHASNTDLDLRVSGAWRGEGSTPAGTADLRGALSRASMPAIYRYLPLAVGAPARRWLENGLQAGQARDAAVTLKGDLADFPFTRDGAQGEFRVAGAYDNATVDYAPARGDRPGWPKLQALSGDFVVDKASLDLTSKTGRIETGAGQALALNAVHAAIPDMEHNAELSVEGDSTGPVSAYLALAHNSPLGRMLHGALDDAQGAGQWDVPLKLQIPLNRVDDTRVDGRIGFQGGDFRLVPQMPYLRKLSGELVFSETALRARHVQGVFLGGPASLSGQLGGGQSLRFSGTLAASQLNELGDSPWLAHLSGKTSYQGSVSYMPGKAVSLDVRSALTGLAVDLPAPLGKMAETPMPLHVQWAPAPERGAGRRQLSATLGDGLRLILEEDPTDQAGSTFSRGVLALGQPVALPARGLRIAGTFDTLDMDTWDALAQSMDTGSIQASAEAPVLPPVSEIDLQAGMLKVAGHRFDDITLKARQPAPSRWQLDVDAPKAKGTVEWTQARGTVAGKVVARLSRLELGSEEVQPGQPITEVVTDTSNSGFSDIPAIDVQVDALSVYGHEVGRLNLQGTNQERGRLWRLDHLQLGNDAATLNATGTWRLDGANRGLRIDAQAHFIDLGHYLEKLGYKGLVTGGSGTINGELTWHDLPWRRALSELDGHVRISLDKGRFAHINSRSARMLELLSLQSLNRLAKLESNPADAFKDGFPFDTIRGDVTLAHGVASTDGYKISGPVATIVLGGNSNIESRQWDMRAVVIPSLDVSGAAVAAAVAVNPFIGLGAFVTQWLLKAPLARAMSAEYHVTGSWDEPKIEAVESLGESSSQAASRRPEVVEP